MVFLRFIPTATDYQDILPFKVLPKLRDGVHQAHRGLTLTLVAQTLKHLPTMWETRVLSLGWEDPLEKEMATHSSTLAWKIPWMEEPGRL